MYNTVLIVYLTVISLFAAVLTVHDKRAAVRHTSRVKEKTLLLISALGGSAAMLVTMLAARHKTRRKKFMLGIPLIIAAQIFVVTVICGQSLSVSRFIVRTEKIDGEIKLALVTDFHSCDYGGGQGGLTGVIDAEQPDAILLCGDIFDDKLPPDNTTELIADIADKYPCYYVTGNHEFWSGRADGFKDTLRSYGVKVLEGTSEILETHGGTVRISGIDDPDADRYTGYAPTYARQIGNLEKSADRDIFTVLLSHRPERVTELLPLTPDLIVSGHAHGGQWRIPYILENGLFAPNQGLFPKYTNGAYFFGDTELIVSRGLARESTPVPRVFNRPELVIITLTRSAAD